MKMKKKINPVEELLNLYPEYDWTWEQLSSNKYLTWQLVQTHITKPWNWKAISGREFITWQIVIDNPQIRREWYWSELSRNPNITWQIVMDNLNYPWDWSELSRNPNITWQMLTRHSNKWEMVNVSRNPNINIEIVVTHPCKEWDWDSLSENPSITGDDIVKYKHLPWAWHILAKRLPLTPALLLKLPKLNLIDTNKHRNFMSYNPTLTWEIVTRNFEMGGWNWNELTKNPNVITRQMIVGRDIDINTYFNISCLSCKNKMEVHRFDMHYLSQNPNVTWEFVLTNSKKKWDYFALSKNINIKWDDMLETSWKGWHFEFINSSRNVKYELYKIGIVKNVEIPC